MHEYAIDRHGKVTLAGREDRYRDIPASDGLFIGPGLLRAAAEEWARRSDCQQIEFAPHSGRARVRFDRVEQRWLYVNEF